MSEKNYEHLMHYLEQLTVIDAHEHLPVESDRLAREVDVLTLLHLYEYVDMTSAGYKPRPGESVFAGNLCLDTSVPLEKRWQTFRPHLQQIKYGSYYRPLKIALSDLYGIDDLNDKTYLEATEKIRQNNTKGLYRRILRDTCNIRCCLVQNGRIQNQDPPELLKPLFAEVNTYELNNASFIEHVQKAYQISIKDLQSYLTCLDNHITTVQSQGALGFKIAANETTLPSYEQAEKQFKEFLNGRPTDVNLKSTVLDHILKKCGQEDFPVAVHCGVWWDYRTVDSKWMIDLVQRHPTVRFDLYHLGMPAVRDTIFIAKNFPNAYLNLCWAYIVSEHITEQAINEIIDLVPINKVFGFGADCAWAVESVYGHLQMARQSLASALSRRIDRGLIDLDGAKYVLKCWLYDNPAKFYGVG